MATAEPAASAATPDAVRAIFPRARGVGASFGVMLVPHDRCSIEVATFRSDFAYEDGRRPGRVRYGTAEEDAQRRDFTINGLFEVPSDGRIVDLVGGRADIVPAEWAAGLRELQDDLPASPPAWSTRKPDRTLPASLPASSYAGLHASLRASLRASLQAGLQTCLQAGLRLQLP